MSKLATNFKFDFSMDFSHTTVSQTYLILISNQFLGIMRVRSELIWIRLINHVLE